MEKEEAHGAGAGSGSGSGDGAAAKTTTDEGDGKPPPCAKVRSICQLSALAKASEVARKSEGSASSDSDNAAPTSIEYHPVDGNHRTQQKVGNKACSQASSTSSSNDEQLDDSSSRKSGKPKKKKPKLDRSKLRKGKWTVSQCSAGSRVSLGERMYVQCSHLLSPLLCHSSCDSILVAYRSKKKSIPQELFTTLTRVS